MSGPSLGGILSLGEIVKAVRTALDTDVLDFLDSGAGDEVTLRRNREAFARWSFRPRVMSGRPVPSTATTFLGIPLSTDNGAEFQSRLLAQARPLRVSLRVR